MAFVAVMAIAIGASSAGAAPASTTCTGQNIVVTPANADLVERSLLCLINVYRADNGRGPLTSDGSLALAAHRHSHDMVDRGYFDHDAPAPAPYGTTPAARAKAAGYPSGVSIGENLAAEAPDGTAFTLFEQWRTSTTGHNELMLESGWVTAGMGIVRGWPGDPGAPTFSEGATLTGLFGGQNAGGTDTAADLRGGNPNATPGPPPPGGGGGPGGNDVQPPKQGERVVLVPTGTVRIRPPGSSAFRVLAEKDDAPIGTTVDVTKGAVQVSSDYQGTTELAEFSSGRFQALQSASGDATFTAKLVGPFGSAAKAASNTAAKKRKKSRGGKRRLWASSDGGHFRTQGRRGSATVRGTRWLTIDIRNRAGKVTKTWFKSVQGVLEVDDFAVGGTDNARIGPGQSYLAGKKKRRR